MPQLFTRRPFTPLPAPSTNKQEIQGVPTDLIIMSFADRIMVTLSQSGKFGTLVRRVRPHILTCVLQ